MWWSLVACEVPEPEPGIQIGETDTGTIESAVATWSVPRWKDAIPLERDGSFVPVDGDPVPAHLALTFGDLVAGGIEAEVAIEAPPYVDLAESAVVVPTGDESASLALEGPPTLRLDAEWGRWFGVAFAAEGGALLGVLDL